MKALPSRLRHIHRTGRSIAVVIPKDIARALGMARGDTVVLGIDAGRMVVRRVSPDELARGIAPVEAAAGGPADTE